MERLSRRGILGLVGGAAAVIPAGSCVMSADPHARAAGLSPLPRIAQPVVEIASGQIRGVEREGVFCFRGIPYGASTAGRNRFRPPQRVEPWQGVRDMLVYGAQCPVSPSSSLDSPLQQAPEDGFLLYRNFQPHISHEDCLRLNVWAPAGKKQRPVMVYMHGGGFLAGSGHDLLAYDGHNLAQRGDVVVVTHNHRLNIFGYLDLSGFGGKWRQSVNLGMQDIVAVLKWVRTNAEAFGGDPDNVTIFGQSGGGAKVLTLMAMPSAQGLFHKAIVQSGAIPGFGQRTAEQSRELTHTILRELGIGGSDPDALIDLPADRLCRAAVAQGRAFQWAPTVDGSIVAAAPGSKDALCPGIPLMVGTVLNELVNPVDNSLAAGFGEAELQREAMRAYGILAGDIVAAYRRSNPGRAPIELWCSMQAAGIRSASYELASRKWAIDRQAWQYLFGWRTPMLEGRPKTFHSAEIAFVFHNADLCVNQTGGGQEAFGLAQQMSGAWVAFARKGVPEHKGLPAWPAFDDGRPVMVFDDYTRIIANFEGEGLRLVNQAGG